MVALRQIGLVVLVVCVALLGGCVGPLGTGWGDAGAIHVGAWRGDIQQIEEASKRGEDINRRAYFTIYDFKAGWSHSGFTPIQLAIRNNQPDSVRELARLGARLTADDLRDSTWHDPAVTHAILDAGVPVNAQSRDNGYRLQNALWFATGHSVETCRVLIAAGADVNAVNIEGESPLHHAAKASNSAYQVLLDAGADPNLQDNDGRTPLHHAVFAPLYRPAFDKPLAADMSGRCRALERARALLLAGADPNLADENGQSPIQIVSKWPGEPGALAFEKLISETAAARGH